LRGKQTTLPGWAVVLQAAREWHVAPWEIEEQCPRFWWEAWQVLREEEAAARSDAADKLAERLAGQSGAGD
jgi:hypothetical protein